MEGLGNYEVMLLRAFPLNRKIETGRDPLPALPPTATRFLQKMEGSG